MRGRCGKERRRRRWSRPPTASTASPITCPPPSPLPSPLPHVASHTASQRMSRDRMSRDHMSRDHMSRDRMSRDHMSRDHMTRDHMSRDHMSRAPQLAPPRAAHGMLPPSPHSRASHIPPCVLLHPSPLLHRPSPRCSCSSLTSTSRQPFTPLLLRIARALLTCVLAGRWAATSSPSGTAPKASRSTSF